MNLKFQDPADLADLSAFLVRAKRLDEQGLVKLRSFSNVLAVYVSPIFSGNLLADGPTVLGLRTIELASSQEFDSAFELSALLERLPQVGEELSLQLPPSPQRAAWTGVTPPREGWIFEESIAQESITQWAREGIAEVAATLPESIGSAIASKVRLQIWGNPVGVVNHFPAGAAFALAGLGFMSPGEQVALYRIKGWVRLSTKSGHVICKESSQGA